MDFGICGRLFRRPGVAGLLTAAAACFVPLATAASGAESRPNVVLILADNVGYGDLGPYGGGELRGFPTPRIDDLARQGLRLTQYLVEPACTPSRAALMTGQYSIRNGLSLVLVPGTPNTLSRDAFTMGDMFHAAGYATAIFGKWHLGREPQSLPTAHGFDEFYGIPPDWSWDSATYLDTIRLTHSYAPSHEAAVAAETMIVEATAGGPLRDVKPYTPEVRAEIDNELTDRAIDFIKRQHAAARPFFVYLPFSMGHYPNLPSKAFAGKSRIGNYGDKMMEGDFHVGASSRRPEGAWRRERHPRHLRFRQRAAGNDGARTRQQRHARLRLQRPVPWRARRRQRRVGPHLRLHPLAGTRECGRDVLRHGLGDGFPADAGRASSAPDCPRTGRSTGSTRATCCSARARSDIASRS